jgi:hypothetical protein
MNAIVEFLAPVRDFFISASQSPGTWWWGTTATGSQIWYVTSAVHLTAAPLLPIQPVRIRTRQGRIGAYKGAEPTRVVAQR